MAQEKLRGSHGSQLFVEIVASILREPVWRRVKNFVVFLHRGFYPSKKACIRRVFLLEIHTFS
jgi:hypothetical protein